MNIEDAKIFIDNIIKMHPNAGKFIVDPTGSGEPLLDLDLILEIGEYCKKRVVKLEEKCCLCSLPMVLY